jgi:adenylylsulfate kinase
MVIWIVGLAGAGKSSLGRELAAMLRLNDPAVVLIDGDAFRQVMGDDLGHGLEDRRRNAWRICRMCLMLERQGITVVCAILALFPETLAWNREHYSSYCEVFLDVPMEVLAARDQKGLYSRALAGELRDVAGVDLPFQPPASPDLVLGPAEDYTPAQAAARILRRLRGEEM